MNKEEELQLEVKYLQNELVSKEQELAQTKNSLSEISKRLEEENEFYKSIIKSVLRIK